MSNLEEALQPLDDLLLKVEALYEEAVAVINLDPRRYKEIKLEVRRIIDAILIARQTYLEMAKLIDARTQVITEGACLDEALAIHDFSKEAIRAGQRKIQTVRFAALEWQRKISELKAEAREVSTN
jgi:hypothetical protein